MASATTAPCFRRSSKTIYVPPAQPGKAADRPDSVITDRAYASGVTRRYLRRRGITAVIPEKQDSIAARRRRGSKGGRPPAFDAVVYKNRNVIERSFAYIKQWRGLATR